MYIQIYFSFLYVLMMFFQIFQCLYDIVLLKDKQCITAYYCKLVFIGLLCTSYDDLYVIKLV